MSYTRGQFCKDVLKALGNANPTANTLNFMLGWSLEESGHDLSHSAAYNLWNTTQRASGSTSFNSVGVQNYTSYAQGIQATVQTLNNGLYPSLITALRTNNTVALGFGSTMSGGVQGDLSVWVSGKRSPIAISYINAISTLSHNPGNSASETANGTPSTVSTGSMPGTSSNPVTAFITAVNLTPNAFNTALDQVHETLTGHTGFYGIALALDEAEQFPGYVNLATSPFDVSGFIRSIGASVTDNTLAFAIRSGLVFFGVLIVALLIAKLALGLSDYIGPIADAAMAAA